MVFLLKSYWTVTNLVMGWGIACFFWLTQPIFIMPLKQKGGAVTIPVASDLKQKWSKTSFWTPTTAGSAGTTASEVGSTKNWVVTLQTNAGGHRGYCSQDLSTTPSSSLFSESLAAENLVYQVPSDITDDILDPNLAPLVMDDNTQPGSSKSRPKQKNMTTVRYYWLQQPNY